MPEAPRKISGGAGDSGRWIVYAVVAIIALAAAYLIYNQFAVTTTIAAPAPPPPVPVSLRTSTLPTIAPIQPTH